jgi:uncharacterized membrane protein
MSNVEEVRVIDKETSHWRVKGPLGKTVEFDARTTEMSPERDIGWNSTAARTRSKPPVRCASRRSPTATRA